MSFAICRASIKIENITYVRDKTDQHGGRVIGEGAWQHTCNAFFLNEKIILSKLTVFFYNLVREFSTNLCFVYIFSKAKTPQMRHGIVSTHWRSPLL